MGDRTMGEWFITMGVGMFAVVQTAILRCPRLARPGPEGRHPLLVFRPERSASFQAWALFQFSGLAGRHIFCRGREAPVTGNIGIGKP